MTAIDPLQSFTACLSRTARQRERPVSLGRHNTALGQKRSVASCCFWSGRSPLALDME